MLDIFESFPNNPQARSTVPSPQTPASLQAFVLVCSNKGMTYCRISMGRYCIPNIYLMQGKTTTSEISTPTSHLPLFRTLLLSGSGLIFIARYKDWLDSSAGRLTTPGIS
jgi:hypothetical protein